MSRSSTSGVSPKSSDAFLLAPGTSVACYKAWLAAVPPKRPEIAAMVRRRIESRFIEPVTCEGKARGGFAALALCCLAIQALQRFRSGRTSSEVSASIKKFIQDNQEFNNLRGHEREFYENVRNSLHHQAQTSGGWRINLSGPVFDPNAKSIGAQKFVDGFKSALNRYCAELEHTSDESPLWKAFITKMESIIIACDSEIGAS